MAGGDRGGGGGPRTGLRDALQRVTEAVLEIGDRYRIHRYAAIQVPELDDARGRIRASLAELLARAQEEGAARADLTAAELAIVWSGLVLTLFAAIGEGRMTRAGGAVFAMRVLAAPAGTAAPRP